eukprot:TRINITY_DN15835_c0_g6_i1.p1 TRINITY_DN15835_c0_g6~~TRINITY_DN15835_c0_g6_i1.p1  ORF type:complete len:430 (+),score=67.34 TRINITY_DN15835_c0_g6_i1:65-1354(+)
MTMRGGGYSYSTALNGGYSRGVGGSPVGYPSRGGSPPPPVYGRSASIERAHQGSPLKERPTYLPTRSTSPIDRYTGVPNTWSPTGRTERRASPTGIKERPSSVLSDNPYSIGSSFKSSFTTATTPYGNSSYTQSFLNTTPPKQRASATPSAAHGASFSSGVYGVGGTPQPTSGGRYGSPTGTPRQRIRGTSFREDYNGMSPRSRMKRAPSMLGSPGTLMIPPQAVEDYGKYSIVLDLDETLIYAREGPLYARPGVDDLFAVLSKEAEGIAWTAGLRAYAQAVLLNIDKNSSIKHCIYRHSKWFTGQAGYQKDLSLLGRPLDRTVIIENTPDCIRANRENGILVADYEGGEMPDATIPRLVEFIRGLVSSGMTVPAYLASCPLLSKRRVSTDRGDFIECYWLDVNSPAQGARSPRINRDLSIDQRYAYSR